MNPESEDKNRFLAYLRTFAAHQLLPTNGEIAKVLAMPERKVEQLIQYLRDNRLIQVCDEERLGQEARSVRILSAPGSTDPSHGDRQRAAAPRPSVETRRKALAEPTGHAWWSIILS